MNPLKNGVFYFETCLMKISVIFRSTQTSIPQSRFRNSSFLDDYPIC